eukprot:TRINITY_DN2960_c0_g1_i10.p1 TRINITY_DN2960_c0_g1~~TRINITY_DN2960_c0_g1_i10.p1  ORF type:complete len:241 (-),score=59.96 TRINITY_DN2960_c0_g1_i10:434-1156(-)
MDIYDNTSKKLKEVSELMKQFSQEKERRIKAQFGDVTKIDKKIEEIAGNATKKLMECESNIKKLAQMGNFDEAENDKRVRRNMQKALAAQIQEQTHQLRMQEKSLFEALRKFNNTPGGPVSSMSTAMSSDKDSMASDDNLQEIALNEEDESRNENIVKIVKSINDLAHVFKQLNQLVIEQGTILDRIDYNIEQTLTHTQKAKKHLKKADEYQSSKRAGQCIKILIAFIIFFVVVLFLKYK